MAKEVMLCSRLEAESSIHVTQATDLSEKVIWNVPEENGILLSQCARVSCNSFSLLGTSLIFSCVMLWHGL